MTLRVRSVVALVLAGGLLLGACGGGSDRPTLERSESPAPSTTVPANVSQVANISVPEVEVYDEPNPAPGTASTRTFENPWHLNDDPELEVPLVFLVEQRQGSWVEVLLPERPNGSTGWIKSSDARLTPNRFRIQVELGAHRITVFDGDRQLLQEPVATGKPETPTPTGKYYLRVLLEAPDPDTVYGPYAYGLSGHSDVLTEFNGGDGEVGIHGNNDASVLGQSVSAGCIRMSNDGITRLAGILPLGTPVEVVA